MYTVVLGVEADADRARRTAEAVADLPGGPDEVEPIVIHSFRENPQGASATQVAGVRETVDILESAGFDPEIREGSGNAAEEILDLAEEVDADLVAVGGRKRTPAGKALFGSTTQSVILTADGPVLVAGEG